MINVQLAVAFLVAWFYFMIGMLITSHDGLRSLLDHPMVGVLIAGFGVLVCLILGLPLRLIPKLRWLWQRLWWLPFLLGAVGLALMVLSWLPPFRQTVRDFETGFATETFQPALALAGWLLSVFAALHFWFPLAKRPRPARYTPRF